MVRLRRHDAKSEWIWQARWRNVILLGSYLERSFEKLSLISYLSNFPSTITCQSNTFLVTSNGTRGDNSSASFRVAPALCLVLLSRTFFSSSRSLSSWRSASRPLDTFQDILPRVLGRHTGSLERTRTHIVYISVALMHKTIGVFLSRKRMSHVLRSSSVGFCHQDHIFTDVPDTLCSILLKIRHASMALS